ncbi:MAG: ribosome small subunit-dependent GTPase A [candidate division KSB1 bacterium]|nr:ribosome small subunit-dependent GTPase A [candidate division KSB1 bacterium]
MTLTDLGFDEWFQQHADAGGHQIARVLTVNRDNFLISTGEQQVRAQLTGNLMYGSNSPLDLPAAGDWVATDIVDDSLAVIHSVLPRKSILKRKTAGKSVEFQLIATNIDIAMIMQSLDANFNLRRLERYLVVVLDSGIQPVILLSKADLTDQADIQAKIRKIHDLQPDLPVHAFSSSTGTGLESMTALLQPGCTYCLLGSSGVGKTTLMNRLLNDESHATTTVRRDGKGRHTTTRRELLFLPNGAMILDTPGMRELGHFDSDTGLSAAFSDIAELSRHCRFNDCTHEHESGCAVLNALENSKLDAGHYENYVKMKKQAAHYSRSYHERRERDKEFGKMVKAIKKEKKKRR